MLKEECLKFKTSAIRSTMARGWPWHQKNRHKWWTWPESGFLAHSFRTRNPKPRDPSCCVCVKRWESEGRFANRLVRSTMIKRRFYREEHGDRNEEASDSSSSSSSFSDSEIQESENDEVSVAQVQDEAESCSTSSGYESEEISGNVIDGGLSSDTGGRFMCLFVLDLGWSFSHLGL